MMVKRFLSYNKKKTFFYHKNSVEYFHLYIRERY